jgi:sarcosine oxidase subunit beta
MNPIADVVIIGAGVMGCATAFHLARAGVRRVVVVEKGPIAPGMTRRSGGLVWLHHTNAPEAQLALAAFKYFQNWKEIVGGDCGFIKTGFAIVVHGETNVRKLRANVAMLQRVGVETRVIGADELKEIEPKVAVADVALAAYEPESGYADSLRTAQAFATRAQQLGAQFRTGTLVRKIRVERDAIVGVDTTAGPLDAPVVVVMAGAWSEKLLNALGIKLGLWNQRGQVAYFERPPELRPTHLTYLDASAGAYFRPNSFNLTFGGLESRSTTNHPDPDHFPETLDDGYIAQLQARLSQRLPDFARAKFARGHAGLYDISPDARAIIDRVPGIQGLYVAAGFGRTGFKQAPAVGACMSELIIDRVAATADLRPFRFTRFAENEPRVSENEYEINYAV